jgi:hypothetical protein
MFLNNWVLYFAFWLLFRTSIFGFPIFELIDPLALSTSGSATFVFLWISPGRRSALWRDSSGYRIITRFFTGCAFLF